MLLSLFSLLYITNVFAQNNQNPILTVRVTAFHQALVSNDILRLNELTDKSLSYGHSNGWVQTRKELFDDLKSGLLTYQKYVEDSMTVTMNETKKIANVRFVATIDATLRGTANTFHLKVLEVWIKKTKNWVLIARQAVKA